MKRAQRNARLDQVFNRLEQIDHEDREVITAHDADQPLTFTMAQLQAHGKRCEERKALQEELAALSAENIEED
jgi:hypothetical protein